MLRLVRPILLAVVLVIAGIWLWGAARAVFSSAGLLLMLALAVFVLAGRRRGRTG